MEEITRVASTYMDPYFTVIVILLPSWLSNDYMKEEEVFMKPFSSVCACTDTRFFTLAKVVRATFKGERK